MMLRSTSPTWIVPFMMFGLLARSADAQVVRSGSGAAPSNIQAAVDSFRTDLGTLNPNEAGSFSGGRREINWDGVPDASAAPNNIAANFFNASSPRGAILSTPGTGFQVSANVVNPTSTPVEFGQINPSYPALFAPFSSQRLFTSLGSNIVDVSFFVPGSNAPALTTGFGSVFSDVDSANVTSIQFFDASNASLGTFFVPSFTGDETLSFLGVSFPTRVVGRVRITSGNQVLAAGNTANDLVVMDDFIFGEPIAVPEPASAVIVAPLLLALRRRRRVAAADEHR